MVQVRTVVEWSLEVQRDCRQREEEGWKFNKCEEQNKRKQLSLVRIRKVQPML